MDHCAIPGGRLWMVMEHIPSLSSREKPFAIPPAPGSSLRSTHRDEKWRDDPLSTFAVLKRKGEGY